jgi:glycosyltransferase involved in cell wall biosynthesis
VHARDVFTQPLRELRRRLRGAVRVVASSEAAAAAARIAAPPGCPVTRVHHGLPLDEYPFHPAARPPLEIAAVGRLEAKKGFDTLIAACTDCCARRPELRLHLVGDGTRRAALERQIASAGLRAQVVLHGWLDQAATREIVARAALCILPSRRLPNGDRDGLANVLLEAMALGTPVITTPAGAAAEIVRDGETGVLVPPDDPVRLSAAIKMLLDAPERRARLATRARDVVEADFDLRRTGALLEQELLGATLAATRTHAPAAMPASPRRL